MCVNKRDRETETEIEKQRAGMRNESEYLQLTLQVEERSEPPTCSWEELGLLRTGK